MTSNPFLYMSYTSLLVLLEEYYNIAIVSESHDM